MNNETANNLMAHTSCGCPGEEPAIDPREAAAIIAEAEWESSPEGQAAWDRECELRREYGSRTPRRSLRDDHPALTARERNPGLR